MPVPTQVMLQRDIIDVSGSNGSLTVGKLPDGIDNSSLTWVPVRLYGPADGGLNPPQFAPDEVCFCSPDGRGPLLIIYPQIYPLYVQIGEAEVVIPLSCSCTSFNSRWEVPIEGVILDGQVLPASNLSGSNSGLSALLDTVIIV
jgi:hypothetical protein